MGKGWGLEIRSWDTHQDTCSNLTQEAQLSTRANAQVSMHTFRYTCAPQCSRQCLTQGERGAQTGRQVDIWKEGGKVDG